MSKHQTGFDCTYWPLGDIIGPFMRWYWGRLQTYPVMRQTICTYYIYQPVSVKLYCALWKGRSTLLYLTWDPDDTQSHNVCLHHLTGECWNALATLPTQLEYSRNKITYRGSSQLLTTRKVNEYRKKLGLSTNRAFLLWGLDTARAIVAHTAGRVAFDSSLFPDKIMHLLVLPHAWRVLGPQVDQIFLTMDRQMENYLFIIYTWLLLVFFFLICETRKTRESEEKSAYRTRSDPKVLLLYKLHIFIHTFVS